MKAVLLVLTFLLLNYASSFAQLEVEYSGTFGKTFIKFEPSHPEATRVEEGSGYTYGIGVDLNKPISKKFFISSGIKLNYVSSRFSYPDWDQPFVADSLRYDINWRKLSRGTQMQVPVKLGLRLQNIDIEGGLVYSYTFIRNCYRLVDAVQHGRIQTSSSNNSTPCINESQLLYTASINYKVGDFWRIGVEYNQGITEFYSLGGGCILPIPNIKPSANYKTPIYCLMVQASYQINAE